MNVTDPTAAVERSVNDFVLSFRRDENSWHFAADRRGRQAVTHGITISDQAITTGSRHMFWAACCESRADGSQHVVVGVVPGLLTEHFFAANLGRSSTLSHAGFSYLPEPGLARRAGSPRVVEERQALIIESITVHPHGLAGELPFVSHRFVEQRSCMAVASASDGTLAADVACVALPNDETLVIQRTARPES